MRRVVGVARAVGRAPVWGRESLRALRLTGDFGSPMGGPDRGRVRRGPAAPRTWRLVFVGWEGSAGHLRCTGRKWRQGMGRGMGLSLGTGPRKALWVRLVGAMRRMAGWVAEVVA